MNQGESTKSIDLVDEVLPDARRVEKPSRTALLLMARGIARVDTAHDLARADSAEALTVARAVGDPLVLGYVQAHYGALLRLDGDLDQAANCTRKRSRSPARAVMKTSAPKHTTLLAIDFMAAGDAGSAAPHLAAAVRHYQNLDHCEGLTRCLGALSALALERDDPHLAARLIGTAAAGRDRFGFKPWPYVTQAERPAIRRRCCPTASTPRNWPPAAARLSTAHSPQPCRSCKTGSRPPPADPHRQNRPFLSDLVIRTRAPHVGAACTASIRRAAR
jgi:hypothetical protein